MPGMARILFMAWFRKARRLAGFSDGYLSRADFGGEDVVGIEAESPRTRSEAFDEQSGADDENQSKRNFGDDEGAAETVFAQSEVTLRLAPCMFSEMSRPTA